MGQNSMQIIGLSGSVLGAIQQDEPDTWSIGYWTHPNLWGNGYATEAAKVVIEFAKDELDAKKILVSHATWNKASQGVVEKLGFKFLRSNPEGFIKNGEAMEEREYELVLD